MRAFLQKAGLPIPLPVQCLFLVDTGASVTCIDPSIIEKLKIKPSGSTSILTPSTEGNGHNCYQYDIGLFIMTPTGPLHLSDPLPIVETSFVGQSIQGLLGRDVLQRACMFYNGPSGGYTLAF
ncbi:hypothetical protein HF285_04665 [Acidithiobacillus ferrooxidans F221]|uniref:retropepsin-like aspartic protease n=1 Tax=Acidithiobacillus ferrooxidans TaxID=920 RepID=UPI001D02DCFE|nr:hypothetical protein [Acidithiobacillus ferrooxidans F221]